MSFFTYAELNQGAERSTRKPPVLQQLELSTFAYPACNPSSPLVRCAAISSTGQFLAVRAVELAKVVGIAFLDLLQALLELGPSEVPVASIDRLELAPVERGRVVTSRFTPPPMTGPLEL